MAIINKLLNKKAMKELKYYSNVEELYCECCGMLSSVFYEELDLERIKEDIEELKRILNYIYILSI